MLSRSGVSADATLLQIDRFGPVFPEGCRNASKPPICRRSGPGALSAPHQAGNRDARRRRERAEKIGPDWTGSARLLLLLAQWVDLGYRDYRFLDALLERFRSNGRTRLSVADYLRLRMAEAFTSLARGESDPAIEAL
jgi:hypothetical protein